MFPDIVTMFVPSVSPNKLDRVPLIAQALPTDCDIVLFEEAFCKRARKVLFDVMAKRGFIYQSPVVGQYGIRPVDGGVVLLSKYPIVEAEIKKFGLVCARDDCLADKGMLYVKIEKEGWNVHIIGTHAQAWNYENAINARMEQFQIMREFILNKSIPIHEPVLVAGDLNVDKYNKQDQHEQMLQILKCAEASYTDESENKYSSDGEKNVLASVGLSSDGSSELLDYILFSTEHLQPKSAETWVMPVQATTGWQRERNGVIETVQDLSDHYPVVAQFTFPMRDNAAN